MMMLDLNNTFLFLSCNGGICGNYGLWGSCEWALMGSFN